MKKTFILHIIALFGVNFFIQAQEETLSNKYIRPTAPINTPYQSNYLISEGRTPLYLPESEGYVLLKCALHLHTVFSDGSVCPTTRVEAAFREGSDAIGLTDHSAFGSINIDILS